MKNELTSNFAKKLFSAEFLDFALKGIKSKSQIKPLKASSFSLKSFTGKIIPRFLKEALRNKIVLPRVDNNILAFRVLLICKINNILNDDSKLHPA